MTKGIIFDVKKYAIHDGPGIRTTVFFKGCPLSCEWCHNPESINPEPERSPDYRSPFRLAPYEEDDLEVIGEAATAAAVFDEIIKDRVFYEESGGGVTFSGGEPLAQPDFLESLLQKCREEKLHAAVDTSGFAPKDTLKKIADLVDLFLFDLKLIDDGLHEQYTGVGNQRILENLDFLLDGGQEVELRFPLIPGVTDREENIEGIKGFISEKPGLNKISILPFHDVKKKYSQLGLHFELAGVEPPDEKDIQGIVREFETTGIKVEAGG